MDNLNAHLFRPLVFYFINTDEPSALTRKAVFGAAEKLKEAGFGGCVIFNKPPDGFKKEEYLEYKWFELTGCFAEAGRKLGIQIWINDGFDFPPGDAGGRIQKRNPDLKQKMFVRGKSGKVEIAEAGWGFPAFEEPESSELFIELVYEKYREHLGEYFGRGITGFFSDADCRRFGPVAGEELRRMPAYYPCSVKFMEIFKARHGREPDVSAVMSGAGGQEAEDYWELAGELYAGWFACNYRWCRRNGLKYTFHTSDTGPFPLKTLKRSSIYTEGEYLEIAKLADFPGTDHELLSLNGGRHFGEYRVPQAVWGAGGEGVEDLDFYSTRADVRAKYAWSAAFLYGRERVMCEAFAATNWGADFQKLRHIASWQIMQGVNLFILHAWHHRLKGCTKYFAPPDFSDRGGLYRGLKEFNSWLAEMSALASAGQPAVDIALFDPTRKVWREETDSSVFFDACSRLNRMPYSYVIANEACLLAKPGRFRVLVNPGLELSARLVSSFTRGGGVVIGSDDIYMIPKLLGEKVKFKGDGRPHYTLRRTDDGREMLLAANIDSEKTINGRLEFKNSSKEIKLEPGEIKAFQENPSGVPRKNRSSPIVRLQEECAVKWERKNIIPLSRLEDSAGRPHAVDSGIKRLFFKWSCTGEIPGIELMVPAEFSEGGGILLWDGKAPARARPAELFFDRYLKFAPDSPCGPGEHAVEFRPGKRFINARFNNIYLAGDFSAHVRHDDKPGPPWLQYYSMRLLLPEKAVIELSRRREKLRFAPWEEQGHPFYYGGAEYLASVRLPDGFSSRTLVLPEIRAGCSATCNGRLLGKRIFRPWEFNLPPSGSECLLRITVWNTPANMLEGYKAGSGIIGRPFIRLGDS